MSGFSFQDDERVGDVTTLEALLAPASDFPGYDAMGGEDWEREEDPDLVDEPVLQLDMQVRTSSSPPSPSCPLLSLLHFHPYLLWSSLFIKTMLCSPPPFLLSLLPNPKLCCSPPFLSFLSLLPSPSLSLGTLGRLPEGALTAAMFWIISTNAD